MSGTALESVIDALTAVYAAAAPSLQVVDGPIFDTETNWLAIGWSGKDTQSDVEVHRTPADAALMQFNEDVSILCTLAYHTANSTAREARQALTTTFNALDAALAADRRLGDVAEMAYVSEYHIEQIVDQGTGAFAYLYFTVEVKAQQ